MDELVNSLTQELAAARHSLHKAQNKLGTAARSLEARSQELAEARAAVTLLLATLDSTTEGVLAVGHFGRAMHFNARFIEIWRIPDDKLAALNDSALLAMQLTQVKDPEAFLAEVESRKALAEEDHHSEVELTDGRVLEWRMKPQRVHGRRVGTVTCYREKNPSHTSFTPVRNMPVYTSR
jgi:sensor histidine kinase regulating citrate/malate metabolism